MRELTIIILIGLCGILSFKVFRLNQTVASLKGGSQTEVEEKVVADSKAELENQSDISAMDPGKSVPTGGVEVGSFNPYFDEGIAFAKDELFAVTSKQIVPTRYFEDRSDKSLLGSARKKSHPPVHVLRCLGRETRENYLFIVDQKFYDAATINQKFTREQLSNWEKFLSEEKMDRVIFTRRLQKELD